MWRAEWRKIRTTRTFIGFWAIAVVAVAIGNFSTISSSDPSALTGPLRDQAFHLVAAVNLSVIAVLVGVRSMTDEFRHGTITWTMLARPDRGAVLVAKAAVAGVAGAVMALSAQVVGVGVAAVVMTDRGGALELDGRDAATIAGLTLSVGMMATIGVAAGALIRNQTIAVTAALVWMLAVENLGDAVVGGAARLFPGQAARSLGDAGPAGSNPAIGSVVLVTYVGVLLFVASRDLVRRPLLRAG